MVKSTYSSGEADGHNNPHSVDVSVAKESFGRLSRQLSHLSQQAERENSSDVEKGHEQEPFDLREYLTSSNGAYAAAGIKHKHVGVTWDDLQVDIVDDLNSKVTFTLVFWLWHRWLKFAPEIRCNTRTFANHFLDKSCF